MEIGGVFDRLTGMVTALMAAGPTAYVVVFATAASDVLFPIIPSEAIVLVAAVFAGSGHLDVAVVAVAAALGAFVGDNVAHGIGRSMGRPPIERVLRGRVDRLDWVETRLQEHGPSLIIGGRFLPGGRSVVAVGSGVLRMRWVTYAFFDAIAVTIWSLQVVVPGYIGGAAFSEAPWVGFLVGAVISLGIVATIEGARWLIRRRRREPWPAEMEDPVSRLLDRASERLSGSAADERDDGRGSE
jgi:membrane protein DedA with SNARE-associated domain